MKKFYILCLSMMFVYTSYAQFITLHHEGNSLLFKGSTAFAQAYEASQDGDTLYFSGGTFFPPATLSKELTLFGAGHYQDSTEVTGKTFFNGTVKLSQTANNFYIEGISISGKFEIANNEAVTGVTIKRCFITNDIVIPGNKTTMSSNIVVIGSVFRGGNFENAENVLVSNSIISDGGFFNSSGNSFMNNIIFYAGDYHFVFADCHNNTIANNIIHRAGGYPAYIINGYDNVLKYNLFTHSSPQLGTNPILSNNYFGVALEDLFVNQTGTNFDYAHNYHLQDETLYVGHDVTQVGIYGGIFPYKEGAVPKNPHIMEMNISDTTNEEGELPVKIKVSTQKDQD
ncbi:MAG: right-handed parallel beta-helix repeat-containing protein [Bacteroidales bacterium]|nr:right-handed parallel beta-helix repeat-containing protein [Bacteroidales bacterium]